MIRQRDALSPIVTWLAVVYSALVIAFVSWLDAACFFEIWAPLRYWAWGAYVVLLLPLFNRYRVVQAIAAVASIWMLIVLPSVRWNHSKSFYVDARRIEVGMTASEVRRIMEPHMELGVDPFTAEEQEWLPPPPDPTKGMLFLHCALGYTDHCEVHLDEGGRVRDIYIEKD